MLISKFFKGVPHDPVLTTLEAYIRCLTYAHAQFTQPVLSAFLATLFTWGVTAVGAALDDIIIGNEPDYWGEYAILIESAIVFFVLGLFYCKRKNE